MMFQLFKKPIKSPNYSDPFLERLPSTIIEGGMFEKGNLYLMDYAIKNMPPSDWVFEIGSWAGYSSHVLLYLMKRYGRTEKFLSTDPWIYEGFTDRLAPASLYTDGSTTLKRLEYMNYIKTAFMNSHYLLNADNLPNTFRYTSDEFFIHFANNAVLEDVFQRSLKLQGQFSFAYIDGNHAYDFAKRDFENVAKYLCKNGFIVLDDSKDGLRNGDTSLIAEIEKNAAFKIIDKNPNYLIQKISH